MLKMVDLLKDVEEKYISMLEKVNIVDFTKCVAIFSGLDLNKINDETIKEYLLTWAKNKFRIYEMLGNNLVKDINFDYEKTEDENGTEFQQLITEYPHFGPWLNILKHFSVNKIDTYKDRYILGTLTEYFRNVNLSGMTITHLAKRYLKFPDEVITKIGRIYENNKINATYTISIDPIDIMTASENPYDWQSCYRLETENSSSHADGCMAAVLDTASIISYVWTSEGKLDLYGKYELKKVRYKRMRQWINVSKNLTSVSFCEIYPGKNYPEAFYRQLRDLFEQIVADYFGETNYWKNANTECDRHYLNYGYSEFNGRVLYLDGHEPENIWVYNEEIKCACGCGYTLPGAYDEEESGEYLGAGFSCQGWSERLYCEYKEDYCSCGECSWDCCEGCSYWEDAHPVCEINQDEVCENYNGDHTVRNGVCYACEEHCEGCSRWIAYKENEEIYDDSEDLD